MKCNCHWTSLSLKKILAKPSQVPISWNLQFASAKYGFAKNLFQSHESTYVHSVGCWSADAHQDFSLQFQVVGTICTELKKRESVSTETWTNTGKEMTVCELIGSNYSCIVLLWRVILSTVDLNSGRYLFMVMKSWQDVILLGGIFACFSLPACAPPYLPWARVRAKALHVKPVVQMHKQTRTRSGQGQR